MASDLLELDIGKQVVVIPEDVKWSRLIALQEMSSYDILSVVEQMSLIVELDLVKVRWKEFSSCSILSPIGSYYFPLRNYEHNLEDDEKEEDGSLR